MLTETFSVVPTQRANKHSSACQPPFSHQLDSRVHFLGPFNVSLLIFSNKCFQLGNIHIMLSSLLLVHQ